MPILKISDLDLKNQRVLIRADLNVPLISGKISSDKRIQASIPTIQYAIDQGSIVMVMSHLGRPKEGEFSDENSLQPIADYLRDHLGAPVRLQRNWINDPVEVELREVVVLDNCRFNIGEKNNDEVLA